MNEAQYSGFYVDLDVLFDTRASTLFTFGEEVFKEAFNDSYYSRKIDQFKGITKEAFDERYQNRTKQILKDPMMTPVVNMLKDFVKQTYLQSHDTPFEMVPMIYVNVAPYVLSDNEKSILLNSLRILVGDKAPITILDMKLEELTPQFVKKNLNVLVMYEYYRWLEHFSANETFKRVSCPDVTLLGPQLYFKALPTQAELAAVKELKVTHFQAMELTAAPFIKLILLPIDIFSMGVRLSKA